MLSTRLIQMIEDHWEPITAAILRRIRTDRRLEHVGKLPESELRDRAENILHHLGHWLVGSKEQELMRQFESLGAARFAEGIPLDELVLAYQLIKAQMIDFVHHQGLDRSPVEIYAHHELQHAVDRVFDSMIYHIVRGYESAAEPKRLTARA